MVDIKKVRNPTRAIHLFFRMTFLKRNNTRQQADVRFLEKYIYDIGERKTSWYAQNTTKNSIHLRISVEFTWDPKTNIYPLSHMRSPMQTAYTSPVLRDPRKELCCIVADARSYTNYSNGTGGVLCR